MIEIKGVPSTDTEIETIILKNLWLNFYRRQIKNHSVTRILTGAHSDTFYDAQGDAEDIFIPGSLRVPFHRKHIYLYYLHTFIIVYTLIIHMFDCVTE
jgi:hypothetical protein